MAELDRRTFLKELAVLGGGLVAAETVRRVKLESVKPLKEPQADVPAGMYLSSEPGWFLRLVRKIPAEVIEQYNGPEKIWGVKEMGGVLLVPGSYFGGKEGADDGAREKLRRTLVFRADTARDERTDEGWTQEELSMVQRLLPYAIKRNEEFFGPPRFRGLVRVTRPGRERRETIKVAEPEVVAGAVMAADNGVEGNLQIFVLTSLGEYAAQLPGMSLEKAVEGYVRGMNNLLAHEVGHVWFLGTKLGFLDNHNIVRTLGFSTGLLELMGKSAEEINEEKLKTGGFEDSEKMEMVIWKTYKIRTGREFYADLLRELEKDQGVKPKYDNYSVTTAANILFSEAGFEWGSNFPFTELYVAFGRIPKESEIETRPMEGYRYPVEKVAGDAANPEGMVSWWTEYKVLSPVPTEEWAADWVNQVEPFPDKEGYWRIYKFAGNGRLEDGPPADNSAMVATWMEGGSYFGGEVMFPLQAAGVEKIYATTKV